jgi:hypothetical protein
MESQHDARRARSASALVDVLDAAVAAASRAEFVAELVEGAEQVVTYS